MRLLTASPWATALLFGLVMHSLVAAPLSAQPEAYARHWPVVVDEAGIYAVTLTPSLYGQIEHSDLSDLAAFNRSGEALGFEPLTSVWQEPEPQWQSVPWFTLTETEGGREGDVSVQVQRAEDGSVSLRAQVESPSTAPQGRTLLVDTGIDEESDLRLQALELEFDPQITDFSAQLRIEASHDLEAWRVLTQGATLLRLQQGGQLLERRHIELPNPGERYLKLRRLDSAAPLPLQGLKIQTRAAAGVDPRPPEGRVDAVLTGREGRTFFYRLASRIPADKINLRLAHDNTVIVATLSSRDNDRDTWRRRGRLTAFRLRAEGVELDNEALRLSPVRERRWRVEVDRDMAEAPTLEFTYRPERWLLLTQGSAPYVVAAGSTHARRETMPVAALMAPIRAKYGPDWQPAEVTLGQPVIVAGDAATQATLEERWSSRVLWFVLVGSALAIALMVVRLLRQPAPPPQSVGSADLPPEVDAS